MSRWTDDAIETLRAMWRAGYTAREITREIGPPFTRNAVIGKAHRLGLSARPSPLNKRVAFEDKFPPVKGCEFPIGHPGEDGFHFCGKRKAKGKPYCQKHTAICYRKYDSKKSVEANYSLRAVA